MRVGIATILLLLTGIPSALAQKQLVSTVDFEEALQYYRPRIALAQTGEYAVSWEVLRKLESSEEWQISMGRFSAGGERIDAGQHLLQATPCDHPGYAVQDNTAGYLPFEKGLRNVEMHFSKEGLLVVSMEQFQLYRAASRQSHKQVSSVRISVLDQHGQEYHPVADDVCAKKAFDAAGFDPAVTDQMIMPRIDLDPGDNTLLGTDGRLINVLPATHSGQEAWKYQTHLSLMQTTAPGQVRSWTDIATNGWLNVSGWQHCKTGENATEEETCDVEIQFFSNLSGDPSAEIVVNQDNAAGVLHYRPAVAMNASGNSVVVWVDYRDSEYGDIYGQRFDAHGRPQGDNFKVSAGNGVIDGEDGSRPEVALLDDGRFLVVWTEHHDHGMRAWGRYFESNGQAKAKPFLLDPDPTLNAGFPDVAANGNRFAFTWLVDQDNVTSVFANIPGVTNTTERAASPHNPSLSLKGYPNPFTHETTLEYSLKESGHVTLVIFDLLGREVKKLIDKPQGPGSYRIQLQADELATGYYVTRLQQGNQRHSQMLVRTE